MNDLMTNLRLYRYFSGIPDIFGSRIEYYMAREGLNDEDDLVKCASIPEQERNYLFIRLKTERMLADSFLSIDGKIHRKHPYYMILGVGNMLPFSQSDGFFGYISFGLEEFDIETISFTVGDSIPVLSMDLFKGASFNKKVYSYRDLSEVVNEYETAKVNFADSVDYYIEAQIWSDEPIEKYRINSGSNESTIRKVGSRISLKILENYPDIAPYQIGTAEGFDILKKDSDWKWFLGIIQNVDGSLFENSRIHGVKHAQKCAVYAYLISILENVDRIDLRSSVIGALFHDIGRKLCKTESEHGEYGAKAVGLLVGDDPIIKNIMVKNAIRNHNLIGYIPNNIIEKIIMDADALDYVRLGLLQYDISRVRTQVGKRLLRLAIELNYYMMLNDIPIETIAMWEDE